jgi:cation diffusion facilitator family transporter
MSEEGAHGGSGSTLVVIKALGANLCIAIAKFVVAFVSGSAAMLSEAVHSLADTSNQVLLLFGLNRSRKEEDKRHEFGYATERYFWAFIVAVLLFTMGATVSVLEGIDKIRHRHDPNAMHSGFWAYIVLGLSMCGELFSFRSAVQEFNRFRGGRSLKQAFTDTRDIVVFVVMFEDAADLAGLTISLAGIMLAHAAKDPLYDGLASIGVGGILAGCAWLLAWKTKHLLIGEAVTAEERAQIIDLAATSEGVRKVIHLRTMHLGPEDVICAMKVAFDDDVTAKEVAQRIDQIEERLRKAIPHLTRIYIEVGTIEAPGRPAPQPRRSRVHMVADAVEPTKK